MAMRLTLSKKNKTPGLFVYCNLHNRDARRCRGCPAENHVYKVKVYVPGTTERRFKILTARNEYDAIIEAAQFRKEVKNLIPVVKIQTYSVAAYCMRFIQFCERPTKNRLPVSDTTIRDYNRHLRTFGQAIRERGYNPTSMRPQDITPQVAQITFDYVRAKFPSPWTQHKYFRTYCAFYNYLLQEEQLTLPASPFTGWNFNKQELPNEIITRAQFEAILQAIETAPRFEVDKRGKRRYMYFPWIADAFCFALFSGARRQEIPLVKWSDVICGASLSGGVILLRDRKNTLIQKKTTDIIKPVEINEDLADLLARMGYEANKGKDEFIFPQATNDLLSRSFGYYAKFCNIELSFKCLRKTWFTRCARELGEEGASVMGGHSGAEVTATHYINKLEAMNVKGKFKRLWATG